MYRTNIIEGLSSNATFSKGADNSTSIGTSKGQSQSEVGVLNSPQYLPKKLKLLKKTVKRRTHSTVAQST
jgi:hypothetical protein